jgi:hypothetical protein
MIALFFSSSCGCFVLVTSFLNEWRKEKNITDFLLGFWLKKKEKYLIQ